MTVRGEYASPAPGSQICRRFGTELEMVPHVTVTVVSVDARLPIRVLSATDPPHPAGRVGSESPDAPGLSACLGVDCAASGGVVSAVCSEPWNANCRTSVLWVVHDEALPALRQRRSSAMLQPAAPPVSSAFEGVLLTVPPELPASPAITTK